MDGLELFLYRLVKPDPAPDNFALANLKTLVNNRNRY
jgi:hypothetical protein